MLLPGATKIAVGRRVSIESRSSPTLRWTGSCNTRPSISAPPSMRATPHPPFNLRYGYVPAGTSMSGCSLIAAPADCSSRSTCLGPPSEIQSVPFREIDTRRSALSRPRKEAGLPTPSSVTTTLSVPMKTDSGRVVSAQPAANRTTPTRTMQRFSFETTSVLSVPGRLPRQSSKPRVTMHSNSRPGLVVRSRTRRIPSPSTTTRRTTRTPRPV